MNTRKGETQCQFILEGSLLRSVYVNSKFHKVWRGISMINPLYTLNRSEMYRIFFTASLVFVKEQLLPRMAPELIEDTMEYLCFLSDAINIAIHKKYVEKGSIATEYLNVYVQLMDAVFSHKGIAEYATIIQVDELYLKAMELVKTLSEESNYEDLLLKLHNSYYHWLVIHKLYSAKVRVIH